MKNSAILSVGRTFAAAMLFAALALTFTVADYYIFNRIAVYGAFAAAQWLKKAGLLLIPAALFFGSRRCADCAKYVIPVAVLISAFTCGGFFGITRVADTDAQAIYNSINGFISTEAHTALFCIESVCMLAACGTLFCLYGFGVAPGSAKALFAAIAASLPLNIFENFFDADKIPEDSFLMFRNFSVWHFAAVALLAGATVGAYMFIRRRPESERRMWLCAVAGALLLQYHSKDSMVMGDGYNIYTTVFSCLPLFICNIGVYTASLAVFTNKKALYATSFFVHAGGALTVFLYFGRDDMSDYGIFCSYSILYFCATHVLLFMLCVLPAALGLYKFTIRQCILPLIYYFAVIVCASVASAAVTGYSYSLGLTGEDAILPNYAFTQVNPLPFTVPALITLILCGYEINILYVMGLYAVYVGIFFTFYLLYRLYMQAYMRISAAVARMRVRARKAA